MGPSNATNSPQKSPLLKRRLPFKLRERWKALYGTEPPPRASCDLIKRAVAYRIQERLFGGLSVSTRRLLERVAKDAAARRAGESRADAWS
jgi:hypothetical protein